jgi:hypothetical protein
MEKKFEKYEAPGTGYHGEENETKSISCVDGEKIFIFPEMGGCLSS